MMKQRTKSVILKKSDGSKVVLWLEEELGVVRVKSHRSDKPGATFTDVNFYLTGSAYYYPSGSFQDWKTT